MNQSALDTAVALFRLGTASPDALIAAANEVVDGGVVTPSSATLSMMSPESVADVTDEFTVMLRELDLALPTPEQAVRTILHNRLGAIASGEIEPLAALQRLDDEIDLSGRGPLVPDSAAAIASRIHYYCEVCDPEVTRPDVRRQVDAETIAIAREWLAAEGA